jgi:hypothetical protein
MTWWVWALIIVGAIALFKWTGPFLLDIIEIAIEGFFD